MVVVHPPQHGYDFYVVFALQSRGRGRRFNDLDVVPFFCSMLCLGIGVGTWAQSNQGE